MKILLGDFNEKVGRENIFKPNIRNESLHENRNVNVVTVVKLTTSKYLIVENKIITILIKTIGIIIKFVLTIALKPSLFAKIIPNMNIIW